MPRQNARSRLFLISGISVPSIRPSTYNGMEHTWGYLAVQIVQNFDSCMGMRTSNATVIPSPKFVSKVLFQIEGMENLQAEVANGFLNLLLSF